MPIPQSIGKTLKALPSHGTNEYLFPSLSEEQFAMREDSDALLTSALYRTISRLIGPHEKQDEEDR